MDAQTRLGWVELYSFSRQEAAGLVRSNLGRRPHFPAQFVDSRGDEGMSSTWSYLDITPFGRQEIWEDSPEGYPQTQAYGWWNRHDEYENATTFEHALSEETASQRGSRST